MDWFKLFLLAIGTAAWGGCESAPPVQASEGGAARVVVWGDWDDVEPAAIVGASEAEMAILNQEEPRPGERLFRLVTVLDQPAVLRAVRQSEGGAGGAEPIELSAEVGRFGDRAQAARLVRATAERLEDLAGVDYRPLD